MATQTDIVNVALRRIGANRISSFQNDSSKEAVVARDLYDEARRDLLNMHTWNFAIKRDQLTASDTTPAFGWSYAYELPDDFVRLVSAHPSEDDETVVDYRLEYQQGSDRVLLCDANQLYIRYVWDAEDCSTFSAAFRDILAWRLARDFAAALSKTTSGAQLAQQMYERGLARAKAIDGIEDFPEKMAEGSWVTARWPDDAP